MGWLNINGNWIGRNSGKKAGSWQTYWTHQTEVLFFGLYSEILGGQMPNKVDGGATFLTVAGVAGSETYQCPNIAPYQTADTDYIWFQTDVSQRTTTTAELIGYDFTRTIVKYANTAPYAIEAIMILSSDVDTAKMRDDFDLSVWWSNVLSDYGNTKDNRAAERSVWIPEGTILASDTFTDTDSTKLNTHTMDVGDGWTAGDTWVITGNKLDNVGLSAAATHYGVVECNSANVEISVDISMDTGEGAYALGVVFRYDNDSSCLRCGLERDASGTPYLYLLENGTLKDSVNVTNETITDTLKITISGNNINCFWKNMVTPLITYESAVNNDKTKHGLSAYTKLVPGYDALLMDNFLITKI